MVKSGVPDELPQNQTLAYAQRVSWRESIRLQKMLTDRVGITDFGGTGPIDPVAAANDALTNPSVRRKRGLQERLNQQAYNARHPDNTVRNQQNTLAPDGPGSNGGRPLGIPRFGAR